MSITQKGDIQIKRMREIRPTEEDFFLMEFDCITWSADTEKIVPMLFGDDEIGIHFWKNEEGSEKKPTTYMTGLKWKTFNMDDNILIMVKSQGHIPGWETITILITRKYQ